MDVAKTLASLKFLNYCLYTLIVPFMPLILEEQGISTGQIGLIFSAYPAATIVFTPIIGHYMHAIGRKRALLMGSLT